MSEAGTSPAARSDATTMRAAVRDRYGGPDVVRIEEVARPSPTRDDVSVRMVVAAVNRADLDGLYPKPQFIRLFYGLRAPKNRWIGLDVAGVVDTIGPEVKSFKPGDRVFADLSAYDKGGAFSEYVLAPERAWLPIPAGMAFETAASLPHSAVLAVQGLRRRDGTTPKPGAKVVIDGASGNVGPFAIQVAKALGAEVTAVASGGKLDFVRSLGADHALDYRTENYATSGERYDWIVDVDSHQPIRRARRALAPGGTYVTLGGTASSILGSMILGPLLSRGSDRWSGLLLWWKPFNPPDVAKVLELIEAGKLRPALDRTFTLDQTVEALRYVDEGRASGKVLITP